jgi:hypothetical protein
MTMNEMIWQCDQVRAGQLYNRINFETRQEALEFVQKMQQMEPDQMFSIAAMDLRQIWN